MQAQPWNASTSDCHWLSQFGQFAANVAISLQISFVCVCKKVDRMSLTVPHLLWQAMMDGELQLEAAAKVNHEESCSLGQLQ